MPTILLARRAMNTRFELVLQGEREPALRAAGEEALDEIERLEAQLSLFRPTSEIARLNRDAARGPLKITPPVFHLLAHARALWELTAGAFDPTIGPLMGLWGFRGGMVRAPAPAELAKARAAVGMDKVELNPADFTVRFSHPGVKLDLGACGKGFALDRAVGLLREAGVTRALIHGGTSSVFGLGHQADGRPWKVTLPAAPALELLPAGPEEDGERVLAEFELTDTALGISAVSGRVAAAAAGNCWGHVLDPRTGEPVRRATLAAVVLPSAFEADALSTALLVLGEAGLPRLRRFRPSLRAQVQD